MKEKNIFERIDEKSFSIVFDLSIYRLSSIKKAFYKFMDKCSVLFSNLELNQLKASVATTQVVDDLTIEILVREICNEVLDQDLRESIAEETEPVRNLILAHAFSQTSLVDK